MKLKNILTICALISSFASVANAGEAVSKNNESNKMQTTSAQMKVIREITNPFYVPSAGKILSVTNYEASTTQRYYKLTSQNYTSDARAISQELAYGVTDNLTVFGRYKNNFDAENNLDNDWNQAYIVGARYNHDFGKIMTQTALEYETFNPEQYEKINDNRWLKSIQISEKIGYQLDNGVIPYVGLSVDSSIDTSDRTLYYDAFVGAYKRIDNIAVDGGINYRYISDQKDYYSTYAVAKISYYFKENIVLGLFGSYELDTKNNNSAKLEYSFGYGINVKVEF